MRERSFGLEAIKWTMIVSHSNENGKIWLPALQMHLKS